MGSTLLQISIRQIKYLNNIVEQDHHSIKHNTNPLMGFKAFHFAEGTFAGVELWRIVKKRQYLDVKNTPAFEQFYALAASLRLE